MSLKGARERIEQGSVCRFGVVYQSFDTEDKETFDVWIGENRSPHWLFVACATAGIRVAEKTIRVHLQGYCNCPTGTELKGVYLVPTRC